MIDDSPGSRRWSISLNSAWQSKSRANVFILVLAWTLLLLSQTRSSVVCLKSCLFFINYISCPNKSMTSPYKSGFFFIWVLILISNVIQLLVPMSLLYAWSLPWPPQTLAIGGTGESPVNTRPAPWQLQKKCPDVLNWIRYSQWAQMTSENPTAFLQCRTI